MAIYSVQLSYVQRSEGQNAVNSVAYISGSSLSSTSVNSSGQTVVTSYDYSKKEGVIYSKILGPEDSPDWVYNREELWNAVEEREKRVDAQTGRKLRIALPKELTQEQNIELVEEFAKEYLVEHGMIVDAAVHYDNENNPHVHYQVTTRKLEMLESGRMVFGNKERSWGRRDFLKYLRTGVAQTINSSLEKYGHLDRVSELSHKARGIDLRAGVHEGPANYIKNAELAALNQSILEKNAARIRENPELVLSKLSINKPLFTKEDIAKELKDAIRVGIKANNKLKDTNNKTQEVKEERTLTLKQKRERTDQQQKELEKQFEEQYLAEYLEALSTVLASSKITLINEKDLKGRTLYALTSRVELEKRYSAAVEELSSRNDHSLQLTEESLLERSKKEQIIDQVSEVALKLQEQIKLKLGLKKDIEDKQKISLSAEQKGAALELLNGKDLSILGSVHLI